MATKLIKEILIKSQYMKICIIGPKLSLNTNTIVVLVAIFSILDF